MITPASTLNLNAMPASTWHHLKMNDASLDLSAELLGSRVHQGVIIEASQVLMAEPGAFKRALGEAQLRHAEALQAQLGRISERIETAHNNDPSNLNLAALSAYQKEQILAEESKDLMRMLPKGLGEDTQDLFAQAQELSLEVPAHSEHTARIQICEAAAKSNLVQLDIVAHEGSSLELELELIGDFASQEDAEALLGVNLRIVAEPKSSVNINSVQLASTNCICLDGRSIFIDEGAKVSCTSFELGAKQSYTGLGCDLRGSEADMNCNLRHLCALDQKRDFTYTYNHHGANTTTNFDANGVMTGKSSKCMRATIDLITGCAGANGQEQETLLICDDAVTNRTIPIILCSEDDVTGAHGATIGHINPEQLYYLTSRGISAELAESLFISAKLEDAAAHITSPAAKTSLAHLAAKLAPNLDLEGSFDD